MVVLTKKKVVERLKVESAALREGRALRRVLVSPRAVKEGARHSFNLRRAHRENWRSTVKKAQSFEDLC